MGVLGGIAPLYKEKTTPTAQERLLTNNWGPTPTICVTFLQDWG